MIAEKIREYLLIRKEDGGSLGCFGLANNKQSGPCGKIKKNRINDVDIERLYLKSEITSQSQHATGTPTMLKAHVMHTHCCLQSSQGDQLSLRTVCSPVLYCGSITVYHNHILWGQEKISPLVTLYLRVVFIMLYTLFKTADRSV